MKRLIILTLSLGFTFTNSINAQELVVNGGFESYSNLPTGEAQWWHINSWNNVNMQAIAHFSYATPDYYHEDANQVQGYSLPISARGYIEPHTGKAIVGLLCFNPVGAAYLNFREYLSNQLASPMVVGETYTVSFWMSNAEAPPTTATHPRRRYGSSSKGMGIRFSTSPLTQATRDIISVTPQIEVTGVPWSAGWTLYSYTYVATSAWRYITIGNFTPTASQSRVVEDATAQYTTGSYYFIDDVSIVVATPLPVELISFEAKSKDNFVKLDWSTASELNNDYFTVEKSSDLNEWEVVGEVSGAGNSTVENSYQLIDRSPINGTCYYRLYQIDYDGKKNFSGIQAVNVENYEVPKIYPNPTSEKITIEANWENIEQYSIVDNFGRNLSNMVIINQGTHKSSKILDLTSLPKGVYYFISNESKQRIIKL